MLVIAIGTVCILHRKRIIHLPFLDSVIPQENTTSTPDEPFGVEGTLNAEAVREIAGSDLSIHFLELGNKYTGDCTLIKTGNTEVLIDAGSRQSSAGTIKNYVNQYCTDGVLEYVIATHADRDHISAFVGTKEDSGILYAYEIGTLIQFPKTNKNTDIYNSYLEGVEYAKGRGTQVYTALECYNNENGASRSYSLGGEITMEILYQKFYETATNDENDYSVCMLLDDGTDHYLFTGDLEKDGEASLVEENNLPKCKLYKGGHHGSPTSSSKTLMSVVQPEIVCICTCCGTDEYKANPENVFPAQSMIDNIAPYTDKVYITTMATDTEAGFASMNGNIVLYKKDGKLELRCSNNTTKLKDTAWFQENRTAPSAWR